jgi:hypothetical protein
MLSVHVQEITPQRLIAMSEVELTAELAMEEKDQRHLSAQLSSIHARLQTDSSKQPAEKSAREASPPAKCFPLSARCQ